MYKISDILCRKLSWTEEELHRYARTCPFRYKTYTIDKRNGNGTRTISQPSKDLKLVQRILIDEIFDKELISHDSAKAYKSGLSILENATPHLKNQYLLKMDFKDFFPSIKAIDFSHYLHSKNIITDDFEKKLATRIFFKNNNGSLILSIGSPGSPIISNALLYSFDENLTKHCEKVGITYTRYSDDISFSTNLEGILGKLPEYVRATLSRQKSPKLNVNEQKTVFSSKKFNRHITGITISNDETVSLGRKKKREIRTRVFTEDGSDIKRLQQLRGVIAYAHMIEPEFVKKLHERYPSQMKIVFRKGKISQKITF